MDEDKLFAAIMAEDRPSSTPYRPHKAPIWPLFAAPFAAIFYYFSLEDAFLKSLEYVVGEV